MGNGHVSYDSNQNRYFVDLAITGRNHDASEAWKKSFEYVSQILFEATCGQVQLGKLYWLKNGGNNKVDDVFLIDSNDTASTNNFSAFNKLSGYIYATNRAMREPLVLVHELGHYLFGLGEEYNTSCSDQIRRCSNDPTTHRSIMEFASGHGIRLTDQGVPDTKQPAPEIIVSQFCTKENHSFDPKNPQQQTHNKSCWETMIDGYPKLKPPPGFPKNKIVPVTWIERRNVNSYSLAILGSVAFAAPKTTAAIKNATQALADFAGKDNHQLALFSDSNDRGIIRLRNEKTLEQQNEFILEIEKLDFNPHNDTTGLLNALGSFGFEPEASMGAYQHLVILASGDYPEDLSPLIPMLCEYRIQLSATTYGPGKFADQMKEANEASKWIEYHNIPAKPDDPEAFAFSLQNHWVENYFLNLGNVGIVELQRDKLPELDALQDLLPDDSAADATPNPINLEIRSVGADLSVFVEETAESAFFILSELEAGNIELTLIAPDGTRLTKNSVAVDQAMDGRNVHWLKVSKKTMPIAGRWFVRLRRIKGDHVLPFQLMVTSTNPSIYMTSVSQPKGGAVNFEMQIGYQYPLDFVDATVDVYQAHSDDKHSYRAQRSMILKRQQVTENGIQVALSNGKFVGAMDLEAGDYIAIFRTSNSGRAAYATNSSACSKGIQVEREQVHIPTFTRITKSRFTIE